MNTKLFFTKLILSAGLLLFGWTGQAQNWDEIIKAAASDAAAFDQFGNSVSISGDTAIVGAYSNDDAGNGSGAAYIFTLSGTTWTEQAKLTASDAAANDFFGWSVSISGDTALVGANRNADAGSKSGSAYIFTRTGTNWTEQAKLTASDAVAGDEFGTSVSISGDTALIGARDNDDAGTNSGSAYIFTRSGTNWTEQAKLTASDGAAWDRFGYSVSISGDTALVGAYANDDAGTDAGSAYIFTRSGTTWTEQTKLTASDAAANDNFGWSVSISGDTALVGAYANDDDGTSSGAAYIFTRSGTNWTEQTKLTASDAAAVDLFGISVSISGDTALVGAYLNDDAGTDSGSAYIFTRSGTTWTEQAKLTASDAAARDEFGTSVSISGDTALIGAVRNDAAGAAYFFGAATVADPCENDTEDPVISCPVDITVNNDAGACGAVVNYDMPTVTDNCTGSTTAVYGNHAVDSNPSASTTCLRLQFMVFTPINSGSITSIALVASKSAVETGSLIIQDTDICGTPTILGTSDVQTTITGEWITWNFPTPVTITAGTQYFITTDIDCMGVKYAIGDDTTTATSEEIVTDNCYQSSIDIAAKISVNEGSGSHTFTQTAGLASGEMFPLGTTTNTYLATDAAGNTDTCSFDITVESATSIWNGANDTAWDNAANWDNAPGLSTTGSITIPTGLTNYPVLTSGQDLYISNCSAVTIDNGASLTVNPNAIVSNDGTVTNNGTLTFKSNATGSAYIGSGTGTFIGDATIERYIPAKRAYRQLASPVTTSTPISENWQQDTHITGSASGDNGFDTTNTGNSSMYIFDNSVYNYVEMANTNATNLIIGNMYHTLVRGDRNTDLTDNNATPSVTTLKATGELTAENEGSSTLSISVPNQRFIAVGNPFQAPVNMNTVLTTNTTNIASTFYWVWDPTLGYRGAYTAVIASAGIASSGDSDANQFLQAGQASWVNTMGAGASSISFTQDSKATSESETAVFKSSAKTASVGKLRLSLYESSALNRNESATDGLLVLFDTEGNNAVDGNDAAKFTNLDENFATNNEGVLLSIENRAAPQDAEEIQLEINTYRNVSYTIVAEGISMQGATAYLFDTYTNVSTEIPQSETVNYAYTVDSGIPASIAGDRFKIKFQAVALSTETNILDQIKMYPNPTTTGNFYLNIPASMDDLEVTIYNALGAQLYYNKGLRSGNNIAINTNALLSQGIYFVKLSAKGKTTTKKLNINK